MHQASFSLRGLTHKISSAYVTTPTWRTYPVEIQLEPEQIIIDGIQGDAFALFVTLEVEGFGRTCLPVDGDGMGLPPGNFNLAVELLRSRMARCVRLAATGNAPEWQAINAEVSAAVAAQSASESSRLLGIAIVATEELLYQQKQAVARRGPNAPVISATLFGERRGEYAIGVGPDWPVDALPDFTRDPRSQDLALALIQGTTIPSFWRYIEFEQGKPRWERIDQLLERAKAKHLRIKSFALYWGGIGGCPPWLRDLPYAQQLTAIERWVETIVTRYKGEVHCWETVNEMHNWCFGNPFHWSHAQLLEVTRLVNEQVGALDPGVPRLINHCCIWGDYVQSKACGTWSQAAWDADWTPLAYLDEVCANHIPFEVIGLQYYNPGRDILTCYETLEKFAAFGKELQITEIGTPSAPARATSVETGQTDPMSGWRGPWTPERQALWLDRFYGTMGAHPQVTAFNYWDFDDAQAFIGHAGLVDGAYQPKSGYQRLQALAQQWRPVA